MILRDSSTPFITGVSAKEQRMPALINGGAASFLLWVINGLLGFIVILFGVILKMHRDSDIEHQKRTDKEIEKIRERLHNHGNRVAEVIARLRWIDEDKEKIAPLDNGRGNR